jgi:ribosomal protein S25
MARDRVKRERQQTSQIAPHFYILKGIGRFENMKDLRSFLGVSRQAIRKLMQAGVIKKIIETNSQELFIMKKEHEDRKQ